MPLRRLLLILPILLVLGQPVLARPADALAPAPRHAPQDIAVTRPSLPRERNFETPHFRIHYTLSGVHAVPLTDQDHNGIPDYVEFVGEIGEQVWAKLVTDLGWPRPFPDGGLGGNVHTDIYPRALEHMGWTSPDDRNCGDHPFTAQIEHTGCSAFLLLDNELPEASDSLRLTMAHEFMHVLQYGLDASEPSEWLWEAWAVWAEEQVFDEIDDYLRYLPDLFTEPDASLDAHPYAAVLLPLWIGEHVSAEAVRECWLQAANGNGMVAVSAALAPFGVSAPRLLLDFGAALVVRYPCPALAPFCWEEGGAFPAPAIEGVLKTGQMWDSGKEGNQRLDRLGRDIIRVKVEEPSRLLLKTPAHGALTLQLLAVGGEPARQVAIQESPTQTGRAAVIVARPQAYTEYFALISAPSGQTAGHYTLELEPLSDTATWLFLPRVESGR